MANYISNLPTLWQWGGDSWSFTPVMPLIGSRMPAWCWWIRRHHKCVSRQHKPHHNSFGKVFWLHKCSCSSSGSCSCSCYSCIEMSLIYVADSTASWSSSTMFQYITSLTQNAAVKPGTIFISRPLVPATEDGSKSALVTNGTELTVSSEPESVVVYSDDQLQVVAFLAVVVSVFALNQQC